MPEVARRLERQRDETCLHLALGPSKATSESLVYTGGPLRLRAETVGARYRALSQNVLRELAQVGEAAMAPGFDVYVGHERMGSILVESPPFQPGIFVKPGGHWRRFDREEFIHRAEQTKHRDFEAMMSVWRVAQCIQDFHRSVIVCREHVQRHSKSVSEVTDCWDAARMVLQTECMCFLRAVVMDMTSVMLCMEAVVDLDERRAFRRSFTRSLWCASQRMVVFS